MSSTLQDAVAKRQWTWMVYLAGDNNLEKYSTIDLKEMKQAGSTSQVALVAQVDRMSDQVTRRYFITRGGALDKDIVQLLPETNTGDPKVLLDFIRWAIQNYPAEHYALVLWNHGSGWKEDDIYKVTQRLGVEKSIPRGSLRGLTAGKTGRSLFITTLEQIVSQAAGRAIAYDDSDADFLDNAEMKKVLQTVVDETGHKIDLLGFDACLMNMLEVDYQVRSLCDVVVGSQEVEPGDGWPYNTILNRLVKDPGMTAGTLGQGIVNAYTSYYKRYQPLLAVTQSAVQMDRLAPLIQGVNTLAQALMTHLDEVATLGLLFQALRNSQSFSDRDYLDLGHYCRLLMEGDPNGDVGVAAKGVWQVLQGPNTPVLSTRSRGKTVQYASGISIYLPARTLSERYSGLDFAKDNLWDDFLGKFTNP